MENVDKTQSKIEISELRNWVEEQIDWLKVMHDQKQIDALTFRGIHSYVHSGDHGEESNSSSFHSVEVVEEETFDQPANKVWDGLQFLLNGNDKEEQVKELEQNQVMSVMLEAGDNVSKGKSLAGERELNRNSFGNPIRLLGLHL